MPNDHIKLVIASPVSGRGYPRAMKYTSLCFEGYKLSIPSKEIATDFPPTNPR